MLFCSSRLCWRSFRFWINDVNGFAVRSFLPRIAYAEVLLHRRDFPPDTPDEAFQIFLKHLADADFE